MRKIQKNKTLITFYLNHLKEERSFRRLKMTLMLVSAIVISLIFLGALYFLIIFVAKNLNQKIHKDDEILEFGAFTITLRFFLEFTISLAVSLISLLLSWISWASFCKTLSFLKTLKKIKEALEEERELMFKTPKKLAVSKRVPLYLFKSNFPIKVRVGNPNVVSSKTPKPSQPKSSKTKVSQKN